MQTDILARKVVYVNNIKDVPGPMLSDHIYVEQPKTLENMA
jgi:hypothetical protein